MQSATTPEPVGHPSIQPGRSRGPLDSAHGVVRDGILVAEVLITDAYEVLEVLALIDCTHRSAWAFVTGGPDKSAWARNLLCTARDRIRGLGNVPGMRRVA